MIKIQKIHEDKKQFLDLLLLADEMVFLKKELH